MTMRVTTDVSAALKACGSGRQTCVNALPRETAHRGQFTT